MNHAWGQLVTMPSDSTAPSMSSLSQDLVCSLIPSITESSNSRLFSHLSSKVRSEIKADKYGGTRKEWNEVSQSIVGLAEAGRIRVQEDLAEGLEKNLSALNRHREQAKNVWEEDVPIKMDNLPQHLHFLLNLAEKPTYQTHAFAYDYIHRSAPIGPTPEQLLYQQIMEEDPFDPGEVWDEEVRHGWTDSDTDVMSDLSAQSPSEDEIATPGDLAMRMRLESKEQEERAQREEEELKGRAIEELAKKLKNGYWKEQQEVETMRKGLYSWKELTTNTSVAAMAKNFFPASFSDNSKAISASQLQRELIFSLSGRPGILFTFDEKADCQIISDHPHVKTFSPGALEDILMTFRSHASQASKLRLFVQKTFQPPVPADLARQTQVTTKAAQAFGEAIREVLELHDTWLSNLEASFTLGSRHGQSSSSVPGVPASTTPLLLIHELEQVHAPILRYLSEFVPYAHSPTLLLNLIYSAVVNTRQTGSTPHITSSLFKLFYRSAEPMWHMLGIWLQQGMPVPLSLTDPEQLAFSSLSLDDGERELDREFFIKRDKDVSWADEDFWDCGFVVRDEGWPMWMGDEIGTMIMEAGKAQGLLRSLLGSVNTEIVKEWSSLVDVLTGPMDGFTFPFLLGETDIVEKVVGYLRPLCQLVQFHLRRVLDEECGLMQHLEAIEGTMLLRGFEVIHEWTEGLFKKIVKGEPWSDFQLLTSSIRTVTEARQAFWMNPDALRIRTTRPQGVYLGPRALGAIRADYLVPFPLSQIFTETSIAIRAEVFTFLLQLSMGRWILAETKRTDKEMMIHSLPNDQRRELRSLWCMRGKLLWLLDVVYSWLTGRVIETQTASFRNKLEELTSLGSMITLELEHTRKIRDYCFLNPAPSDLLEAIFGILDMTCTLSDSLSSFKAQSTPEKTPQFVTKRRRRVRRPQRDLSSDEEMEKMIKGSSETMGEYKKVSSGKTNLQEAHRELQCCVGVIKNAIEKLSMERDGDLWAELSIALEEWH
ncbi:hypothetical protein C356_06924 [Cryptococcus neoformans c45]|nr:hypothetical protein C356_06924 [Cryptococcus neoformans var. grubii c45]